MDETEVRHVLEAALLASHKPLPLDKLLEIFKAKAPDVDRDVVRKGLEALEADYESRNIELKQVASGYRIQIRSRMTGWLQPLWEERPPRYSRALLETLALIAYRQPVTRGEIEEVRGVAVNANIIRTMLDRDWIRVVGHRDVPGKPEMFGTTKQFLDYFGLKSMDQLPALAETREGPEAFPQTDFIEGMEGEAAPVAHADSGELDGSDAETADAETADADAADADTDDEDVEVVEAQDAAEGDAESDAALQVADQAESTVTGSTESV